MWKKWTTLCLYIWCQVLQVSVVKCECGHESKGHTSPLSSLPPLGKTVNKSVSYLKDTSEWQTSEDGNVHFYAKEKPWFIICPQEGSRCMEITLDCGGCRCSEGEPQRQWRVSVFTLFITELSMFAMIRSGILLNSLFFYWECGNYMTSTNCNWHFNWLRCMGLSMRRGGSVLWFLDVSELEWREHQLSLAEAGRPANPH